MNDFNQDMQNLLNAYDSNWEDYLILREQFIEKYSLSVEKLQEIRVEELKDFNSKILQAELKNQKLQEELESCIQTLITISILANGDENIVIGNFVDSRLSKLAKNHENVTKYIEKVTGKNIDVVLAENAALEAEGENE